MRLMLPPPYPLAGNRCALRSFAIAAYLILNTGLISPLTAVTDANRANITFNYNVTLNGWPGLHTVLAVETIRHVNGTSKVDREVRYLLSSCPDSPAILGKAIRSHWAVENALHWVLDVTFREDDSRVRDLALLRKIALNIVGRDRTSKVSVRGRRKKAAWNDAYMLKLLVG